MNHLELKGAILLHLRDLKSARDIFKRTYILASKEGLEEFKNAQQMYLAATAYLMDSIQVSLNLIRNVPEHVDTLTYGTALGWAGKIYLKANYQDTAYMIATTLIDSVTNDNRKCGFELLFSPPLINKIPIDSLVPYIIRYSNILENYVTRNSAESARLQQTYYNYQNWERKYETEHTKVKSSYLLIFIMSIVLIFISSLIILLVRKNIKNKNLIKAISRELEITRELFQKPDESKTKGNDMDKKQAILRDTIYQKVLVENVKTDLPDSIQNSFGYKDLSRYLTSSSSVNIEKIWPELEASVLKSDPGFKSHLAILAGKELDDTDYWLALAIKFGCTPKQCARLFCIEPSSLSYRRKNLATVLFGKEFPLKKLDQAIRFI